MRLVGTLLVLVSISTLQACSLGECPDGSDVDYAAVQALFTDNCITCHSSELTGADRQDAPAAYDYDTYAAAIEHPTMTWTEVNLGHMPPNAALSDDDKETIRVWYACETPE
jgi:mono/diheme cytochrome c family protein